MDDYQGELAELVRKAGISKPEFESITLQLSPSERRLFFFLLEAGTANTNVIRSEISIGNVSECALTLNKKLEREGDARRVLCEVRPHKNKFGQEGQLGWWSMKEKELP